MAGAPLLIELNQKVRPFEIVLETNKSFIFWSKTITLVPPLFKAVANLGSRSDSDEIKTLIVFWQMTITPATSVEVELGMLENARYLTVVDREQKPIFRFGPLNGARRQNDVVQVFSPIVRGSKKESLAHWEDFNAYMSKHRLFGPPEKKE
jgi:hypothetical protein